MATLDELWSDLEEADRLGETAIAQEIYRQIQAAEAPQPPQETPGLMESLMAGDVAGIAESQPFASGIGLGLEQMYQNVRENVGLERTQATDRPTEGWEEAGRIGGRLAPAVASMVVPGGLAVQMGLNAPLAMLEEDPVEAALWGAGGTAVGSGIGRAVGRPLNAKRGRLETRTPIEGTPEERALLEGLRDSGGVVTRARATGDPGLLAAEQRVATNPWTRPAFDRMVTDPNQEVLQETVGRAMGSDAVAFTDEALEEISGEIGERLNRVGEEVGIVPIPESLADRVTTLDKAVDGLMELGEFKGLDTGLMDGQDVMRLRTRLMDTAMGTDRERARIAREVVEQLDELVAAQADFAGKPDLIADWAQAREQYRNYLGLRGISGGGRSAEGTLTPATLQTRMRNQYKKGPARQMETREMQRVTGALASGRMKPYQHSPGTAETSTLLDPFLGTGRGLRAMYDMGRLAEKNPSAARAMERAGRLLVTEEGRESL